MAVYVVVLLAVQSVMGRGIDKFKELWGNAALDIVAYSIVAVGAGGVLWIGYLVWTRCSLLELSWLGLALAIYAAGTVSARNPQERLHYLGYGLLTILLYVGFAARSRGGAGAESPARAGSQGRGGVSAAAAAYVVGLSVGYADELLQILWPRRYFDWADVGINAVAVGLGVLVAIPLSKALARRPV